MSDINPSFKIFDLTEDCAEYDRLAAGIANKSAFFLPSYLKCAQLADRCPIKIMALFKGDRYAMIPYAMRQIRDIPLFREIPQPYRDITAPHEFYCVVSNADSSAEHNDLASELFASIEHYCRDRRIVSEFVRFDPFLTDAETVQRTHLCRKVGDNIYVDLKKDIQQIYDAFDYSVKKNLRRAQSSRLSFRRAEKCAENSEIFRLLYWASMDRLKANPYFYFSHDYFDRLIMECEGSSLFIVSDSHQRPIAASIVLHHDNVCYHHLTGSDQEAASLRPNDFMIYSLILWGISNHYEILHLGGGAESICRFKSKFSKDKIPYYVGARIHDQKSYETLCEIAKKSGISLTNSTYFPLYRLGL
ncbi:MAG: GNAT family N-acetyltransferase [Candidatus Omnitrophota bacterium]